MTGRQLLRLVLAQVCVHSTMTGARLAAPLLALKLGHSAAAVGVLLACYALSAVFLALPAGRLADRYGLHRPLAIAVAAAVLGAGMVGTNAAKLALGLGAQVNLLDISHARLQYLDDVFGGRVQTHASNAGNLRELLPTTDLLIGAVLIPGSRAPQLVTRDMLELMRPGSVIVDVAVDQGGCIETIHATTHESPTYVVDGVVHYGVANMPGAVPNTSTRALSNQTLPYALKLAATGTAALLDDPAFLKGLNVHAGAITYAAVGHAFGLPTSDAAAALRSHPVTA